MENLHSLTGPNFSKIKPFWAVVWGIVMISEAGQFKEKLHYIGSKLVHPHRLKAKVEIAVKRNFLFSLKIASLSDGLPVRRR